MEKANRTILHIPRAILLTKLALLRDSVSAQNEITAYS